MRCEKTYLKLTVWIPGVQYIRTLGRLVIALPSLGADWLTSKSNLVGSNYPTVGYENQLPMLFIDDQLIDGGYRVIGCEQTGQTQNNKDKSQAAHPGYCICGVSLSFGILRRHGILCVKG